MAAHPSVLAWRIPWPGEPGGPQSTGSHRPGPDYTHTHTPLREEKSDAGESPGKIETLSPLLPPCAAITAPGLQKALSPSIFHL